MMLKSELPNQNYVHTLYNQILARVEEFCEYVRLSPISPFEWNDLKVHLQNCIFKVKIPNIVKLFN